MDVAVHTIVSFGDGGHIELRQQRVNRVCRALPDEEVHEEVHLDANNNEENLQQESQVPMISIFEFLSLLS